ncbi:hypothetical protein PEX2_049770 [Penicillium expansum]|uniref:Uncharacterized protein n=1 Tax=Penicillium expansum TaxID=27334 RepID=A0A0A2JJE8_PENEN|nr:hypothetical protein PEX2_049770 [Penicillium expansum]KGO55489.1 hypothetical protein PEX2_049770 [Penicillium expansum]
MDHRGLYCPGELDVLYQDRNRSETTICIPSPSPAKRGSSYYPAGPKVLEESNLDPFYLEESLAATPSWNPYTSDMRNDSFEDENQYYTLSLTHNKDIRNPLQYPGPDRSTLAQVELENSLRFHRYTPSTEERSPLHSSQVSFSSVQTDSTTPDLTPSSSFSSSYDSPSCPDSVLEATQQLYKHAQQVQIEPRRRFYLPASTPPTYSLPPPPPPPPVAPLNPADIRPTTPCFQHSNDSTTTITMGYEDATGSYSSRSRRRKQPPPVLNLSRTSSSPSASRRKQSSPGTRPPLDPSMISPPSLINPVTMEPHMTHFDHPLFIPANDCPSPVPSPVASSPPISRQWTATSMERPSISTIDAFCEQSVWESDSDSESTGRKSMSRRPIDTLRKVRSRAKLRAAKSQPRLHQTMLDGQTFEQFPCMPEDNLGEPMPEAFRPSMDRPSTSKDAVRSNNGLQTLRLVAPSSTSLTRPPRSRKNSSINSSDVDRSAAAAFQAQFRRRQRSESPEYTNSNSSHSDKGEKEKLTSFCYDQYSSAPITGPRDQRPLFQRFMNSLRSLNCQKPQKSHKKTNVTTI